MKRERERRGRASAQKQREREKTQIYPAFPSRARLSLSTKKEREKERKSENLAASTVCVPSFFFSEMFALKKRARGGKTRANAKSLRTSRNRVREFLPRANQSRFFLLFARRGKSRRERLLNYARSNFFFLKRKDENFSQKNVIVTFFFPKEHISLSQRERRA